METKNWRPVPPQKAPEWARAGGFERMWVAKEDGYPIYALAKADHLVAEVFQEVGEHRERLPMVVISNLPANPPPGGFPAEEITDSAAAALTPASEERWLDATLTALARNSPDSAGFEVVVHIEAGEPEEGSELPPAA